MTDVTRPDSNPPLSIHRSIRLAPSTTLIARRRLGSLPLHPVKDHNTQGPKPRRKLLFPIDLTSLPEELAI
jgi:hypothetical protein